MVYVENDEKYKKYDEKETSAVMLDGGISKCVDTLQELHRDVRYRLTCSRYKPMT